jgi:outer membrane protein assembly factor BamB
VQTGKDGVLRLIDLDDPSGAGGPGHVGGEIQLLNVPQGGAVFAQPAVWVDPADQSAWVFVANGGGLSGLQLGLDGNHRPHLTSRWNAGGSHKSPILANGVLYAAGACPGGGTCISARDPHSGDVLWSSPHIGNLHWQSPILVDGALYMTDGAGVLWKFALPSTDTVFADGFDG